MCLIPHVQSNAIAPAPVTTNIRDTQTNRPAYVQPSTTLHTSTQYHTTTKTTTLRPVTWIKNVNIFFVKLFLFKFG